MEDAEQVALVRVVVDLRTLPAREDVLDVERMPGEAVGEERSRLVVWRLEVDPGEAVRLELRRLGTCARGDVPDRTGARATDARQARHRY